jgi:hypothetical protein
MLLNCKNFPMPFLLRMIRRTQRAHERDHLLHFLIRKLRLHRHSGIAERRAALPDDRKDMTIRKLIHIRAVRVIAGLRIQRNGSRAIAFTARAMTRAARFDVRRFTQRDILCPHVELKIRRIGTGIIAHGRLILIQFTAGTSARRKREDHAKHGNRTNPIFHGAINAFQVNLISISI